MSTTPRQSPLRQGLGILPLLMQAVLLVASSLELAVDHDASIAVAPSVVSGRSGRAPCARAPPTTDAACAPSGFASDGASESRRFAFILGSDFEADSRFHFLVRGAPDIYQKTYRLPAPQKGPVQRPSFPMCKSSFQDV